MRSVIFGIALLSGQLITSQEKPVVHLASKAVVIPAVFGGKLLELINAPAVIRLPLQPAKTDMSGNPWLVEVKNLGPRPVSIRDDKTFKIEVIEGQTVKIGWDGQRFSEKR